MRTRTASSLLFLLASLSSTAVGCAVTEGQTSSSESKVVAPDSPNAPPPAALDDDGPGPEAFDSHASTAHFQISYSRGETSADELLAVETRVEPLWNALASWVGESRLPKVKVDVLLEGDGMKPDQPPQFPHVGSLGRVHLYRYAGGASGAYERQLEHEVVHAVRELTGLQAAHVADRETGFGFVEEGFAEMLAREIEPAQSGFPAFGHDFDVAVGARLGAGEGIPIPTLMVRHDINVRCMAQAYPLRASFMKFLLETYGRTRLLALAYPAGLVNADLYAHVFGARPEALAAAWETWARARFAARPDGAAAAEGYMKSPIQFFPACKAGVDF